MKLFYSFFIVLSLIGSTILGFYFNYSVKTLIFHEIVICTSILFLFILNTTIARIINNSKTTYFTLSIINFIFTFSFLTVYLLILSSNYFWKKTISFDILKNYIFSINGFLSILPLQLWISYSLILFILLLIITCFIIIKPTKTNYQNLRSYFIKNITLNQFLLFFAGIFILLFFFRKEIVFAKRYIQFSEEPIISFVFGPLWAGENNEIAFEKLRYQLGLKDKDCTESITKIDSLENKNIVIILLDAFRSDHLQMNGYNRMTSPFLDSIYRKGELIKLENSFSTSNNTIGGIAGLFFSKDWENFGFNGLSLMKYCKLKGMSTHAFLTGFHRDWFGLSALYRENCDFYYESADNPTIQDDNDLTTLKQIENYTFQKNSFIFFHLLSTHTIGKKNEPFRKFLPDKVGLNINPTTALINNYDNGILQGDFMIKSIFAKLKKDNQLENSLIYIVGDHGELFGENGGWSHGGNMHELLLETPILVYDNNKSWYKNTQFATLKDVAPSITDRIFNEIPQCWEGKSLNKNLENNISIKTNSVTECDYPKGRITYSNKIVTVDILDNKGTIYRSSQKTDSGWIPKK